MYAQFYAGMRWTALPLFALLLFLTIFLVVIVRTVLCAKPGELDRLSRLPLDADERGARTERSREPS